MKSNDKEIYKIISEMPNVHFITKYNDVWIISYSGCDSQEILKICKNHIRYNTRNWVNLIYGIEEQFE